MSGGPVGFIGLGIMGKQMAQVLLKQGVELVVWNRSRQATEPLVALGARVARSPAEVVDEAIRKAEEKVSGENVARADLANGVPMGEVFRKYGIL